MVTFAFRRCTILKSRSVFGLWISLVLPWFLVMAQLHDESFPSHPSDMDNGRRLTREYRLKQGAIKGLVLEPRDGRGLDGVEVFLGIPYAAAPVGGMRFMPPGSATRWSGLKLATNFAPVCPQMLPDLRKETTLSAGRYNYLKRLMPFLRNQSEDCLYLNIYAPSNEGYPPNRPAKKYPVMIFIHGESFEWNSGNPYDGTVLAAYGQVIVVTLNFRLGILGFMKPSISEHTIGNFGLLDQIAALQWVKDNIAAFNGDPNAVTLAGHGTGAACVNFLMVSPVANGLFHRAILMSGTALSDWAITSNPLQFTVQAAQSLNCPLTADDLGECLRKKRLSEIMAVRVLAPKFMTPFGPIIDGSVIPNEPAQVMGVYKNLFSKYELLYGCTEMESYHLLGAIALAHGMLESERDALLRLYTQARFEYRPDLAMVSTLKVYSSFDVEPGKSAADSHRDSLLDILSDARVTAPMVQTANFHSKANPKSYFYIFGHNSQAGEYAALSKSVHGEELAYMFGVPLGATGNHFREEYSPQEKLFSEIIMTFWSNFARTGNPNTPRKKSYLSLGPKEWDKYDIEWPQYNPENQSFVHLGIPPYISTRYRNRYMRYWNEALPDMLKNFTSNPLVVYENPSMKFPKTTQRPRYGEPPPWLHPPNPKPQAFPDRRHSSQEQENFGRFQSFPKPSYEPKPTHEDPYDAIRRMERPVRPMVPGLMDGPLRKWKTQKESLPPILISPTNTEESVSENAPPIDSPVLKSSTTLNLVVGIGVAFLLINILAFTFLYYKKSRIKSRERQAKRNEHGLNGDVPDGDIHIYNKELETENNRECSVFNICKSSNKDTPDDFYEPVKNNVYDEAKTPKSDDSGGFGQRFKLRRHMSNSTLDAHTKVRDWIAHEIVQRCSPRFLRKSDDSKPETKITICSNIVNLPYQSKDEIDEAVINIPKPNCKIGSLTGSLKSPTDSTVSVGTLDKKVKSNTERNKPTTESKKNSKHTSSSKSSKPSLSGKSTKRKKSGDKNASDGSLRKKPQPQKVSVAIDATPAARSSSVLKQQPIEFSKSLDYCCFIDDVVDVSKAPLRRSQTMEDFVKRDSDTSTSKENVFKSTVNLNLSVPPSYEKPSEIVKIFHKHSASDPVKDIDYAEMFPCISGPMHPGSFHTFSTLPPPVAFRNDINVTCRDEGRPKLPMTPEEALIYMKKRKYPKVLPDLPKAGDQVPSLAQKRLSLPPQNHLLIFPTPNDNLGFNSEASTPTEMKSFLRNPPLPPPRSSSTLGRKPSVNKDNKNLSKINSPDSSNSSQSYVEMFSSTLPNSIRLNSNPSDIMELYAQVKSKSKNRVNMQDIEASESDQTESEMEDEMSSQNSLYESIKTQPRVIVCADPKQPIRIADTKVIIKPVINKNPVPPKQTNIPRVFSRDNTYDKCAKTSTQCNIVPNFGTFPKKQENVTKQNTIDTNGNINQLRPTDLKIKIPIYKPDTKGPPTEEELQKIKEEKDSSEITNQKPNNETTNIVGSQIIDDVSKIKNNSDKKTNSVNRNNTTSKIPKTPTMIPKMSKKDQLKVQHSPKFNKGKLLNKQCALKTTCLPQPAQSSKFISESHEKENNSTSDSSNDTESSTGTVKKVK